MSSLPGLSPQICPFDDVTILHGGGIALEHDPARPKFIVTEPGVGYRLRTD